MPSFSEAIRRALRQDPDVILVGEMRDLETIEAAITAAETGHIVFGTLHTNSAQGTVNRIIDAFPGNLQDQIRTQLSTSIIGVVAQTLLPKIGGGRVRGVRDSGRHAGHRQPDSRKQNVPHQLGDSDRGQVRHAADGRRPVQALAGREVSPSRTCWRRPTTRTTWPSGLSMPSGASWKNPTRPCKARTTSNPRKPAGH